MRGRQDQDGQPAVEEVDLVGRETARDEQDQAEHRLGRIRDTDFEVKKAFVDGHNAEHLWVGDLKWDGTNFRGKINNKPHDLRNVKLGQSVVVAPQEISDWMFIKNGKLIGGYTTRVLYARLSPQDKARFNKEADFKIE